MKQKSNKCQTGKRKIAHRNLLKPFLSLVLIIMAASCTDETDTFSTEGIPLQVNVTTAGIESRGLIESATLPDGHSIGLTLVDAGGSKYDNVAYRNIKAMASTGKTPQTWTLASTVNLSSSNGTLYGYYPYSSAVTDITKVPVTTAAQTDFMYATPVKNLNDGNYNAAVTMNHALAAIRVKVCKEADNNDDATLTVLKVQSDAFYQSATLDATSANGTLSGLTGAGDVVQKELLNQSLSLAGTTYDFVVVPGTAASDITFTATINGDEFTATAKDVNLQQGYIHTYTLSFSKQSEALILKAQTVKNWNKFGKLTMQMSQKIELIEVSKASNGIYAVEPNGKLVADIYALDYTMQQSCIGVALIVNDAPTPQRFMIEKSESYSTNSFNYGSMLIDFEDIVSYKYVGGYTSNIDVGYLPMPDGTWANPNFSSLSGDYRTWTSGALSDFSGKDNSNVLREYGDTDQGSYVYIGVMNETFNQTAGLNLGYKDWYVPACGQLALMYLNKDDINAVMKAIGGANLTNDYYWSSTEYSAMAGWGIYLGNGPVGHYDKKVVSKCRLIRDI